MILLVSVFNGSDGKMQEANQPYIANHSYYSKTLLALRFANQAVDENLSDMWRRPILQLGSNTTGQWGCFSLRQAGADGGELIKCPLKTVTFGATRAFHVTSNRWNTFQTQDLMDLMFVFVTGMTEVGSLQDVEAPSPLIEDYPLYKTEDLVSLCLPRCCCFSHFCALPNPQT